MKRTSLTWFLFFSALMLSGLAVIENAYAAEVTCRIDINGDKVCSDGSRTRININGDEVKS